MEELIFHFNDRGALQVQDDGHCRDLYNNFWATICDCEESSLLPGKELSRAKDSYERLHWLARYASVVLFRPLDDARYASVTLVGLDQWESIVHASVARRESTAIPDVRKPAIFELGPVPREKMDELLKEFDRSLTESEENNAGNMRGQRPGHQGNQRTPSFARAILWQAMEGLDSDSDSISLVTIQGGTTDVSLHTGCIRRNTSFPLVISALHTILRLGGEATDETFNKCVAAYLLSFLKDMAPNNTVYNARSIDRVVTVIREVESYLLPIKDVDFKELVLCHLKKHQRHLRDLKPDVGDESHTLLHDSISEQCDKLKPPMFPHIPDLTDTVDSRSERERARADAEKNLCWSNLSTSDFTGGLQDAWVQLSRENRFFWKIAAQLNDSNVAYSISDLLERLARFSKVIKVARKASQQTPHVMTVDLTSCELLAAWISYCWAHRVAEKEHPLFKPYGAALDPADLRHIALDDARAISAVKCVRRFLGLRDKKACSPFRQKADTCILALEFGLSSDNLRAIYSLELQAANKKIEKRWTQIARTQRELSELDSKLRVAKHELQSAEWRTEESERTDYDYRRGQKVLNSVYYEIKQKEDRCRAEVKSLKNKIGRLETKPANVLFGLPRNEDAALRWLFFLYMPKEFRDLSALAHLGQSMLWKQVPKAVEPEQNLLGWFKSNRLADRGHPGEAEMILGSLSDRPRLSTPDIRQYSRETGVFFPDSFSVDPAWSDGKDPFSSIRNDTDTTMLFTEILPSEVDQSQFMQKFVAMLPTKTRENEGIARRERKPDWLTQEQYNAFSNLRAYPRTQIRYLIETLTDNLLPFQHDCVHILIKQLLFHVGEEDWKVDLSMGWQGLALISCQMYLQLDILRESPKDSDRLLLFGIMSSFFGQYNEDCLTCARGFARTCRRWADDMNEESHSEHASPGMYWKQAKLYGYSILCHSTGEREADDYLEMMELIVLFKHKTLLASAAAEGTHLDQSILKVMASRIEKIAETAHHNLQHLTICLSLLLDDVPDDLSWSPVVYGDALVTGCFAAESDHLYSINLLNGIVLVDGIPPGLLPSSVVDDPLYQRTFGSCNFEIVVLGFRHYRAARFVNDRFLYEFVVDSAQDLHILEHDASMGAFHAGLERKLLLLRRDSLELPPLLRESHSHWYSEHHKAVFLRNPSYQARRAEYVITREATYSLPFKYQELPLDRIVNVMSSCDRLLSGETRLLNTLARFEHRDYIHLTVSQELAVLRYSFPRYKLSFEQTDNEVKSVEFKGFAMQRTQLLEDTLPGLTSCIVLAHHDGREKVVIAEGKIVSDAKIDVPKEWDAAVRYHIYDVHRRFRNLISMDTVGRLHLAALYASSSSYLADKRMGKTGTDVATELVRQCWKNEPLSPVERLKLIEVSDQSNLSCTLRLMCLWIWRSSNSVLFLHDEEALKISSLDVDFLALDEYRRNKFSPRLFPSEEFSLLGTWQPRKVTPPLEEQRDMKTVAYVRATEGELRSKYLVERSASSTNRRFPLNRPANCRGLEVDVYEDLEKSYEIFCCLPRNVVTSFNAEDIKNSLQQTQKRRQSLESLLLWELSDGDGSVEYRLSQVSGRIGMATPLDMVRMTWDESTILMFNPYLDTSLRMKLRVRIVDWAVLCVLEDKLHRMLLAQRNEDRHALLAELECVRKWNPIQHPRWLAFEVEQQLQIRPSQFSTVQQLLRNPGSVIQLNMGLGKTRVLVPMLILDLISEETSIGRVNVLPSIINEAMEYFRSVLVASVQHVELFSLPFHRDIPLEEHHARQLSDEIARCKEHLGCFVVTPQHRNSLLLKQFQFDEGIKVAGLTESFVDIIDESDAILHHDFQLVYALGTQSPLPGGPCRWMVFESFLKMLARNECAEIASTVSDSRLVHRESSDRGTFPKLRLLLPFQGNEDKVGPALCRHLVTAPPHEFRWMEQVPREDVELLVTIMSDPKFQDSDESIRSNRLFNEFRSHILAARGCIAYGLLFHGLSMRYRVNFGLNKFSRKKMAGPFSASDTPKPRAEYSHADMAILYTCLSYLHEGLTESQFKDALVCLQSNGPVSQKVIYDEWVASVRSGVDREEMSKFDNILKVDVGNKVLFDLMYKHLHRCVEVICFWMDNFVFPAETYQFPARRVTSAWNLVDPGTAEISCTAVGFSGTDDNRFLLPLAIHQIKPKEEQLCATNGDMIDRVLRCTQRIEMLDDESDGFPLWQVVLTRCMSLGVHALIDVAGQMAGSPNDQAARWFADKVGEGGFRGIVYFDTESETWNVYEMESKRNLPLQSSSVTEAECFVYFDESRCRGSDMKLENDAIALVTLEPKLTKDKFLQGCARMRKLRPEGQSMILAGTSEVVSHETTTEQVLEKIVHNTASMTKKGVMTYYERGVNYYSFPQPIEDDISLDAMYASAIPEYKDIVDFLDASHVSEQVSSKTGVTELLEYCKAIGEGMTVHKGQLSEECERELENEAEHEEEQEIELAKQDPFSQLDWPFGQAFVDPESFFQSGLFVPLESFISEKLGRLLSSIQWSKKVFCTPNFWKTTQQAESGKDLSLYLRPVNTMLVMTDGRVVLIYAYELENLLPHWWSASANEPKAVLQHLFTSVSGQEGFGRDNVPISDDVLTTVKLFRGYVQFSERETNILAKMFQVPNSREIIQELLFMRRRLEFFDRSDLDNFSSIVRL